MKKFGAAVIGAALAISTIPAGALAENDVTAIAEPIKNEVKADRVREAVLVTDVAEDYITVTNAEDRSIVLNIAEDTVLLDSEAAAPAQISDIKSEDVVLAEYSSEMTKSIPPQATAFFLALNTNKGGNVSTVTVDELSKNEDGSICVTDNAQDLVITISEKAQVKPYRTKNIVRLSDINKGDKLAVWFDTVTLSLPAQAYSEKVVIISAADDTDDSEDTVISDWAKEDIDEAFSLGFIERIIGNFTENITRRDFCDAVYNMLSKIKDIAADKNATELFTDIKDAKINALASIGIINGKGDGLFAPDDALTREEAATILYRIADFLQLKADEIRGDKPYSDDGKISSWAKDAVYALDALGIVKGTDNGFEPQGTYTKEQSAATLMRIFRLIKNK